MSTKKNAGHPEETMETKRTTRFRRRRRRSARGKNSGDRQTRSRNDGNRAKNAPDQSMGYEEVSPGPRMPRTATAPPRDPNVFSYTFTIWKSS